MMIVSTSKARRERFGQSIQLGTFNFEIVEEFVYLGSLITNKNILDEEISRRLVLANRTYYGLQKVFNSKFVSRKTKIQMYKTLIFPVLLYATETWSLNKSNESQLNTFEQKILKKIFGPMEDNGVWRKRFNCERYDLYRV